MDDMITLRATRSFDLRGIDLVKGDVIEVPTDETVRYLIGKGFFEQLNVEEPVAEEPVAEEPKTRGKARS